MLWKSLWRHSSIGVSLEGGDDHGDVDVDVGEVT